MKLTFRQIDAFLARPDQARGALLYGPDTGLTRERAQSIMSRILPDMNDPFSRVDLTHTQVEADPARLHDELSALSFTGGRRLVVLRDAEDEASEWIEPALSALGDHCYLLVLAGDLNARSPLRKLFETEPQLAALPSYKDEGAGLDQVIQQRLREHGIRTNREVIQYLATQLGGNRQLILSELDKLALYLGEEKQLDIETAMLAVGGSNEKTIDQLCCALAERNLASLYTTYDRLVLEGNLPIVLIRSLQNYFTRLYVLRARVDSGSGWEEALASLRPPVFFKQKDALKAQGQRWQMSQITRALAALQDLEIQMKRGYELQPLLGSHTLTQIALAA